MSSIKSYINELKNINVEIKRHQDSMRTLKKKADEVKKNIATYLQEKEQEGVKYNDVAVVLEAKEKRAGKKIKDRDTDAIKILEDYGIRDAESALGRILEARRGEKVEHFDVKLKKLATK